MMPAKKIFYLVFTTFFILSLAACSSASPDVTKNEVAKEDIVQEEEKKSNEVHTAHWTYEGETGPEHWGDLILNSAACPKEKKQSLITIEPSQVIKDKKYQIWLLTISLLSFP